MEGAICVESDGLRRIGRRMDRAREDLADGRGPLSGSEDAGRSSRELTGALDDLHGRLERLLGSLESFSGRMVSVADDFDRTDDDVSVTLRLLQTPTGLPRL